MPAATYRKKPVEIQAWHLTPGTDLDELKGWMGAQHAEQQPRADGAILIHTLEGDMRADIGDWIIRGVKGEFYPCKPNIFDATYDGPVDG